MLNRRIIALHYCVRFCRTSTRPSHRYTHVPSLLKLTQTSNHPIPPLQAVTEHRVLNPQLTFSTKMICGHSPELGSLLLKDSYDAISEFSHVPILWYVWIH